MGRGRSLRRAREGSLRVCAVGVRACVFSMVEASCSIWSHNELSRASYTSSSVSTSSCAASALSTSASAAVTTASFSSASPLSVSASPSAAVGSYSAVDAGVSCGLVGSSEWRKVRHMSETSSSESRISSSSTLTRRLRACRPEREMRSGSRRLRAASRRPSESTLAGLVRSRSVFCTRTERVWSVSSKTEYTCSSMHSIARTSNGASSGWSESMRPCCSSRR